MQSATLTPTFRELSTEEIALVSGAFSWDAFAAAVVAGGITGGLAAAATGAGVPAGVLAGALLGGAGYAINDLITLCF
jgi:hypothetical protein